MKISRNDFLVPLYPHRYFGASVPCAPRLWPPSPSRRRSCEAVVRLPCACVSVRVRVRVVSGPWQYTCWSPRARVSMYCCIHGCGRVSMCHGFLRVPGCVRVSACVLVSARGRVCPPNQYHSPVLLQNVGPALRFQLFKATKSN